MLTKTTARAHWLVILLSLMIAGLTSVSAQPKQVTQQELDTSLDLARSLVNEKKYPEALKAYLFVFDNSRGVSSYGGVRLSYVPSEIAQMGQIYEPAIAALESRRDEREKLALAGKADFNILHELMALNQYLDQPERNITLFDKLKAMGPAQAEATDDVLLLIWEQLVAVKRYDELKNKVDDLAKLVASQIAESAIQNDFPSGGVFNSPQFQNYRRKSILEDGGRVYETSLALGKVETANKLAKWMLTFATD
ncbi:MAG TPA: hypothetical protein VJS17_09775, partial [Pyrinomonadaceae bacterium]|nr:hypothetical protein [Pyrinomonadaceae bacterium]